MFVHFVLLRIYLQALIVTVSDGSEPRVSQWIRSYPLSWFKWGSYARSFFFSYMKKTKITLYEEDKKEEASMRCSLLHGSWDQILRRCPSVRLSHLFDYVPIIVSSWNFQKLSPRTRVRSMQKVKVRGQRSRSQRSQPNFPFPDCNSSLNSHMMMKWYI